MLPEPGRACPSGSKFNLGADGLPQQMPGNFYDGALHLQHPAVGGPEPDAGSGVWQVVHPVRPSMYGHGLFGDYDEVHTTNVRQLGDDHDVITCATDFIGMAEEDVGPEAIPALRDLSKFPPLPDRLQQGFLDFIYLGRLMMLPTASPAIRRSSSAAQSVIDPSKGVFYYGNSQGGIAGGALTAVEPDVTRLGPLRARHELLDPADPQRRLLRLRADPLPVVSRRERPAAAPVDDPDGCGTAASRTATPTT